MIKPDWIKEQLDLGGHLRQALVGERSVGAASIDTRTLTSGDLFFALPGEQSDGHDWLDVALDRDAAGLVISREDAWSRLGGRRHDASVFMVEDVLSALQHLASRRVADVDPIIIAITGSNGKTSCKDLCRAAFSTLGKTEASRGNLNNGIGLPLSLLGIEDDTHWLIAEMGCSSFGEIALLCELFPPRVGIVTNIGAAHLEQLGDLDGVARAKGELPAALPTDGLLLVHGADAYAGRLAALSRAQVRTFGTGADIDATDLGPVGNSGRRLSIEGQAFRLPRTGAHQVLNAAAAWGAARFFGADPLLLAENLPCGYVERNRSALLRLGPWLVIDDSYNANPSSLAASLRMLGEMEGGRRWAVLGDMRELGDQAGRLHRELGVLAASEPIEGVFTVGPLAAQLAAAASEAGLETALSFDSAEEATPVLLEHLGENDILLVKGSRSMAMEAVIAGLEEACGAEREEID